ncbi:MAG: hypothetical protein RMK92_07150 [Armatimonadota bacterium]|nr:hypothetical protein [Armatimonadota bacterium]
MSAAHQPLSKKNGHGTYEKQDVGFRFAILFIVGIILLTVVSMVFLLVIYPVLTPEGARARRETVQEVQRRLPPPPNPVLQANPAVDMKRFREQEELKVSTYGWVDERRGIVRVPVERAMEIVAEQGLPQWQPVPSGQEAKR